MMPVKKYMHHFWLFIGWDNVDFIAQIIDYFLNITLIIYYSPSSYSQLSWLLYYLYLHRWSFPHLLLFMGNLKKYLVLKILS